MIVTVTPNPAVDLTIAVDALRPAATTVVPTAARRAGGKGLNVARVLAQTGHAVTATGPVGRADADWFTADLPGVATRFTPCADATRHTYALVETDAGRTTQLNERGVARTDAEWAALVADVAAACRDASCLTVSGSLPPDTPADVVTRMLAAARAAGVPVVADLTRTALETAAAAGADVVKPNRDELQATVGTAEPVAGARLLQERGAGLVLVSLGEGGLVAVPPRGPVLAARLPRPLRGNATGAGDAAVAAVAACLDDGRDPRRDLAVILRRAVAWSAAAVLAPLAGALDPVFTDLAAQVEVTTRTDRR